MSVGATPAYRFGRYTLDLVRGCLRAGDDEIKLRPKTFEVLCRLSRTPARSSPRTS